MNEVVLEWVAKAESDYALAQLALYAAEVPLTDGVCFHSQQCAEKYLKAFLTAHLVEFPRSHVLLVLLALCGPFAPAFETLRSDLIVLEGYAVAVRYPGAAVTDTQAATALVIAQRVRAFMRLQLQLE